MEMFCEKEERFQDFSEENVSQTIFRKAPFEKFENFSKSVFVLGFFQE